MRVDKIASYLWYGTGADSDERSWLKADSCGHLGIIETTDQEGGTEYRLNCPKTRMNDRCGGQGVKVSAKEVETRTYNTQTIAKLGCSSCKLCFRGAKAVDKLERKAAQRAFSKTSAEIDNQVSRSLLEELRLKDAASRISALKELVESGYLTPQQAQALLAIPEIEI